MSFRAPGLNGGEKSKKIPHPPQGGIRDDSQCQISPGVYLEFVEGVEMTENGQTRNDETPSQGKGI